MKNKLLICFVIILQISTKAQEKFNITIYFPAQLQTSKIKIFYNDGIEDKVVNVSSSTITSTDYFYSKYATIHIIIDSSNTTLAAYHTFYLSNKAASLIYKFPNSKKLLEYKFIGAYDANVIANQYERFIEKENEDIRQFDINDKNLDATTSFNTNEQLRKNLIKKQLVFINHNRNNYYSFQIFKNYIAPSIFSNADSLYSSYKKMFHKKLLIQQRAKILKNSYWEEV